MIQTEMIFSAKSVQSHNWNSYRYLLLSSYLEGRKWSISNCANSCHSITYWENALTVLWRCSGSLTVHIWPVIFPLSFCCGCLGLVSLVGCLYLNIVQLPSCKAVFCDPLLNIIWSAWETLWQLKKSNCWKGMSGFLRILWLFSLH